jgi:arylsulfatase A-like enzyme/Tfp pilus assembly protein PilF
MRSIGFSAAQAARSVAVVCSVLAMCAVSCRHSDKNAAESGSARLTPLNVVVVTLDTLRPDHLHCYGYPDVETPNLDRLANSGVLFENAVTPTPLTPPSHASIFTGMYPNKHHVRNTGGFVLQASSVTLAKIVQDQGWDTGAFIGASVLKKLFGFNQGFAVYDDQMPRPDKTRMSREYPERRAADVVDRSIQWMNAQSGKPFLMWVHLFDAHQPYEPPEPFREAYKNRPYDGEIAYVDRELGRLFEAVNKKAPRNTIFAVLSDHGESLKDHGEYTHGVFLYDATLRVAFILSGPGVPSGVRVKQQVRTIDFLPTVMELMGGKPPAASQGTSLVPAFSGRNVPAGLAYAETLFPKMNMGWSELRAMRTAKWKYIRAPKPELYDLQQDPGETANVIGQHPSEVKELESQLRAAGGENSEKVETSLVDQRTMDQLKSLGYLQGFSPRAYELNGQGIDPKDRTGILRLMELSVAPDTVTPPAKRVALLRQALEQDPTNPALYYHLGGEYEKAGRHADAVKLYESAMQRGIENGRLHSRVADLYLRAGKKEQAVVEYEKAAQFNPSDVESQRNLATAYLELGRIDDAERVFKWIVTTADDYAPGYNGLGLVAIQRQDPATARGFFEKAVQLDPDEVEAQFNLGLIYKMAGDLARARTYFQAFLDRAPQAQYADIIPQVRQELTQMP